jgi:D-aspartate ligase
VMASPRGVKYSRRGAPIRGRYRRARAYIRPSICMPSVIHNHRGMKNGTTLRQSVPAPSDSRPTACVLGEIDLLRALHLGGVRCAVAAAPGEPARYSRAATQIIERVDPAVDPDGMIDRLLAYASTQSDRPVLFYDSDWDLLLVSRERDRLRESFRFVVADADLVEAVVDKAQFQALSDCFDLPVPHAEKIVAGDAWTNDRGLVFPVIVKPLTRDENTWHSVAHGKAAHVDSQAELDRTLGVLGECGLDALVQEAVPGAEDRIESYHVYVDDDRQVVAEYTGRKLRTFPVEYGYTTALEITDQDDVRFLGRELVQRLGLVGVAKLDFKRDPNGRLWLLEVNPRFNLWHHPGALAGINLPLLVYRDLVGLPRLAGGDVVKGVRWCSVPRDAKAARSAGWSFARWLRFVARCDAISGFAARDPLPLPRAALHRAFDGRSGKAN